MIFHSSLLHSVVLVISITYMQHAQPTCVHIQPVFDLACSVKYGKESVLITCKFRYKATKRVLDYDLYVITLTVTCQVYVLELILF